MKNQNKTPKSLIFVLILCACGAIFLNCQGKKEEEAPCATSSRKFGDYVTEKTTLQTGRVISPIKCTDRVNVMIKLQYIGDKLVPSDKAYLIVLSEEDIKK